jgi:hypothetical protein
MNNAKLRIVASNDAARVPAGAGIPGKMGGFEGPIKEFLPGEGLRLLRAFARISDPKQRALLIDQAEKSAGSKISCAVVQAPVRPE